MSFCYFFQDFIFSLFPCLSVSISPATEHHLITQLESPERRGCCYQAIAIKADQTELSGCRPARGCPFASE